MQLQKYSILAHFEHCLRGHPSVLLYNFVLGVFLQVS